MRFVIDAHLPPALARWLVAQGHAAEHVGDLDMLEADDRDILQYAVTIDAVIVSKDEDFMLRRVLARTGPRILWIRRGNTSRRELLEWFAPLLPAMVATFERGEVLIELS